MKAIIILILILTTSLSSFAQIVDIPDANFKNALIEEGIDTNNDGEIQVSEAEVVINLNVSFKNIMSLEGIQSFINLEVLNCSYNQISSLDISNNLNLVTLKCWQNQLSSLNVSQNLSLETLSCQSNQLGELNISQNHNLKVLHCDNNQLSSIDVSQNLILESLNISENPITDLNLSQQTLLVDFGCINCQLNSLNIKNGNNHNMINMVTIGNSNLTCIQVDDENATRPECEILPFMGWCKDEWSFYSEECDLGIFDIKNIDISIFPNPVQDELLVQYNKDLMIENITVYDILGKIVLIKKKYFNKFNLSKLKNGILFVKIETERGTIIKKIIKE